MDTLQTTDAVNFVKDSLEYTTKILNKPSHFSGDELLDKIIIGLISALLALLLRALVDWWKNKIDLKNKRKLIEEDLNNQKVITARLKKELKKLYYKFEKRNKNNLTQNTIDIFEDLHTDIYNSISKIDYFKIYKRDIFILVRIYKKIDFLQTYSINKIYSDYIFNLKTHLEETKDSRHEFLCTTHIQFIKSAQRQIMNNCKSIAELGKDINSLLAK